MDNYKIFKQIIRESNRIPSEEEIHKLKLRNHRLLNYIENNNIHNKVYD